MCVILGVKNANHSEKALEFMEDHQSTDNLQKLKSPQDKTTQQQSVIDNTNRSVDKSNFPSTSAQNPSTSTLDQKENQSKLKISYESFLKNQQSVEKQSDTKNIRPKDKRKSSVISERTATPFFNNKQQEDTDQQEDQEDISNTVLGFTDLNKDESNTKPAIEPQTIPRKVIISGQYETYKKSSQESKFSTKSFLKLTIPKDETSKKIETTFITRSDIDRIVKEHPLDKDLIIKGKVNYVEKPLKVNSTLDVSNSKSLPDIVEEDDENVEHKSQIIRSALSLRGTSKHEIKKSDPKLQLEHVKEKNVIQKALACLNCFKNSQPSHSDIVWGKSVKHYCDDSDLELSDDDTDDTYSETHIELKRKTSSVSVLKKSSEESLKSKEYLKKKYLLTRSAFDGTFYN